MLRYIFRVSYELNVLAHNEKEARELVNHAIEIPDEDVLPEDELAGIEAYVEDSYEADLIETKQIEKPEIVEDEEKEEEDEDDSKKKE